MLIPVGLNDGKDYAVSKEDLQHLLITQRTVPFECSAGWEVLGRDKTRHSQQPHSGEERRQQH